MTSGENADSRSATVIHFERGDPINPRNFSTRRKWTIVASITLVDLTVSWGASGFSPAKEDFENEFNISSQVGILGLSLYVLGLAFGPMTLAPLSEYYGRSPLYIIPYGTFLLCLAGTALVKSLAGFFVLRFLSGLFASVTIANFGGTIADLWPRHEVGPAMSIFLWAAVCGSPSGYFLMSFVAAEQGWREVFWALLGICGSFWLIMTYVLLGFDNETRHSVLLRRRAAKLRKEHSTDNISVPEEMKQRSLSQLFKITLSRPFRFLTTEAIIVFAATYNGYLYGLSFLFNGAFNLVFGETGYGFGVMGVGMSFIGFAIGVSIGPVVNIWQERYYQRCIHAPENKSLIDNRSTLQGHSSSEVDDHFRNIPEARVQLGKLASILLPVSLFWFAWTSVPEYNLHPIVPILATTLFGFSFYTLILMSYVYVEDSYMVFSASALAGVGLARNLAGAGFPLFGTAMFEQLGYNWAGTVLACAALLLAPIPFILENKGARLRSKSPYARQHMDDEDYWNGEDENDNACER